MSIDTEKASGRGSAHEAQQHRPPHSRKTVDAESNRLVGAGQLSAVAHDCLATFGRLDALERATILRGLLAANLVAAEAELTPKDAARRAGVSGNSVRAWCRAGRLGRRVGGRWRVSVAEVRALLAGGRHG